MKVVLTKDVKGIGSKGDTVEQKDGYALNFLIPKGFAVPEKSSIAKVTMQKQGEAADRKEVQHELLNEIIKGLDGETLSFEKKVNEQGGLYDKVDAKEIVAKIAAEKNVELPEDAIALEAPLEAAGEHEVTVSNAEVSAKVTISIIPETT
tara:strand:+ start:130085 stop:130534 length:450 start_codon:yes stop_codon:yes gene_type:complete